MFCGKTNEIRPNLCYYKEKNGSGVVKKHKIETDVLVLGSGSSGFAAAYTAAITALISIFRGIREAKTTLRLRSKGIFRNG